MKARFKSVAWELILRALLGKKRRTAIRTVLRRIGGATGLILTFWLWSAPAQASYICPSGPGAGEVQVGMTNMSGGGMVPVCERSNSDSGPQEDAPPAFNWAKDKPRKHAVMVWHPDVNNVWVAGGFILGDDDAVAVDNAKAGKALGECKQMMGSGCAIAIEWWDSEVFLVQSRNGGFFVSNLREYQKTLAECSQDQVLPCAVWEIDAADQRSLNDGARRFYAVAAWVKGNVTDDKLYVASGHRSYTSAAAAAINACTKATSRPCEVAAETGSGFIQTIRLNNGSADSYSSTVEISAERAREAAHVLCKKNNSPTCELQAQYDAKTPGLFVHDFTKAETQ